MWPLGTLLHVTSVHGLFLVPKPVKALQVEPPQPDDQNAEANKQLCDKLRAEVQRLKVHIPVGGTMHKMFPAKFAQTIARNATTKFASNLVACALA
jgi:hypothetical protein